VGDTLVNGRGLTFTKSLKINSGGIVNVLADRTRSNTIIPLNSVTLSSGAILQINGGEMAEAPYDKTEYQVFNLEEATLTGTFSEILPATPGEGQTWDASELYTRGVLKVVGGDPKPEDGDDQGTDPEPASPTMKVCLAWGNMTAGSYNGNGVNNMLTGNEKNDNHDNTGFSMVCTGNLEKAYTSAGTPKFTYEFDGVQRTGIKLSNGAQNTIFLPEGAKVTKLTIWSVVGTNSSSRTSYWSEVAGQTYTEATATLLDLDAPRTAPNRVDFDLNDVTKRLTFTNSGEQQCVIIVLEYHTGGTSGISIVSTSDEPLRTDYFTLSGRRVERPGKGIYLMRITTAGGEVISRKVSFR